MRPSAPSRLSFRVAAFARTRETRVLANAATRKLRLDDSLGIEFGRALFFYSACLIPLFLYANDRLMEQVRRNENDRIAS